MPEISGMNEQVKMRLSNVTTSIKGHLVNPLLISLVEHIIKILVRLVIEKPPGPKQARTYAIFFFPS